MKKPIDATLVDDGCGEYVEVNLTGEPLPDLYRVVRQKWLDDEALMVRLIHEVRPAETASR